MGIKKLDNSQKFDIVSSFLRYEKLKKEELILKIINDIVHCKI